MITSEATPVVLARRQSSHPSGIWEARIGPDRGRLEVVLAIRIGNEQLEVQLPNARQLQELLDDRVVDEWGQGPMTSRNTVGALW